jgi:hypothetical protein
MCDRGGLGFGPDREFACLSIHSSIFARVSLIVKFCGVCECVRTRDELIEKHIHFFWNMN